MIASPCIGVCVMDETTEWCRGCARSRDEIAGWSASTPEARDRIWAALPVRLDRLGVTLRRPDWDEDGIRAFVLDSLRRGDGTWSLGVHGAVAEAPVRDSAARLEDGAVIARGQGGALRLRIDRDVRAFHQVTAAGAVGATVLAVSRRRLPETRPAALTELGRDDAAIDPAGRDEILFDLGLGFRSARFMIRTADPILLRLLRLLAGMPLAQVLSEAGAALVGASPTRVVEAHGARTEIVSPIPPPGGRSPGGCHTHLLPGALGLARETPPGIELGDAYAPVAIHFPATGGEADACTSAPLASENGPSTRPLRRAEEENGTCLTGSSSPARRAASGG